MPDWGEHMQRKCKVIAAGHVCLDITPVFASKEPMKLDQLLIPGKLVLMDAADVHTGGSVSNTGLALKLFGADVKLVGKVGLDDFGQTIANIFKGYGVEEGLIVDENSTTSYSVVIAAPGVDRIFLHHPGANDTFSSEDIDEKLLEDVQLFHFGYPPIMKRMYEHQGEELVRLFQRMKAKEIMTSLDMAAIDPNSDAGKQDWHEILRRLLPYVDFFLPSAEEVCFMLDPERLQEWKRRAAGRDITELLSIEQDIDPLGLQLIDLGAKVVLIKCGAPGLYYRTGTAEALASIGKGYLSEPSEWANRSGFEKSYRPDRVVSATGAGDTTIAAFLAALLKRYPLDSCLRLATAAGASNVTEYDALSGLRTLPELEERIQKGWLKSW